MAHFLLFELLRPTLLASSTPERAARAVWLSSSNHRLTTLHLDDLNLDKSWDPTTGYGTHTPARPAAGRVLADACMCCSPGQTG